MSLLKPPPSGGAVLKRSFPWIRPALIVGIGLAVFQQISGINTIIYYAPTILNSIGFGDIGVIAGTSGVGVVNVLMTVVAVLLVDRVWAGGRSCSSASEG